MRPHTFFTIYRCICTSEIKSNQHGIDYLGVFLPFETPMDGLQSDGAQTRSVLLCIDKISEPLYEHVEVVVRLEQTHPRVPAASLVCNASSCDDLGLQQRLMAVFVFLPLTFHPCIGCA
jgi:hypothetical protein